MRAKSSDPQPVAAVGYQLCNADLLLADPHLFNFTELSQGRQAL